jgi:phosphatidylcholine synthase
MAPEGWGVPLAAAIMGVSTYTFANTGVKSHDYYFVGFPAVWSLVVLYFHILQTLPFTNAIVIVVCCVLTFVPWKYVHPFRVKDWRNVTIPMTVLWAATSLRLVLVDPDAGRIREAHPVVFWLWVVASIYFAGLSAWRTIRRG